jgi:hypothetical protein
MSTWDSQVRARTVDFSVKITDTNARVVIGLILLSAAFRILLASATGFGVDESYTVANARHFELSYVDYPPLHAWLAGACAKLFGSEIPVLIRLPFIALFGGTTWMLFRLTSDLFSSRAGLWAAFALNVSPVFSLAHGSSVLPDGPLLFFMLLGARVVVSILFSKTEPSRAISQWLMAGALGGLALLSKYHGVFLLLGVFVFLLTCAPARDALRSPGPWLGAVVAVILFIPVVVWNLEHHLVGFFFQLDRVTTSVKPDLGRALGGVVAQAAYLTPWVFAPLAYTLIKAAVRGPATPRSWFLVLIASGPIVGIAAANLTAPVLPHWAMPGWLFAYPLLGAQVADLEAVRPRLVRLGFGYAAVVMLGLAAAVGVNASTGWLTPDASPAVLARIDPTLDLLNWSDVGDALSSRDLITPDTPAVAALNWVEAGKLNYAIGRTTPVLCLCVNPQEFRYLNDSGPYVGMNVLILSSRRDLALIHQSMSSWFEHVETLPPIVVRRAGRPAIELAVFRGVSLRPDSGSVRP